MVEKMVAMRAEKTAVLMVASRVDYLVALKAAETAVKMANEKVES